MVATFLRLRNVLPDVGIIALAMLKGNAYRQAALAAGADDVVRKAALTTDLLPAIRRVTQAKRPRRGWVQCRKQVLQATPGECAGLLIDGADDEVTRGNTIWTFRVSSDMEGGDAS
jgi:DNA-binding response OmpR family regulator